MTDSLAVTASAFNAKNPSKTPQKEPVPHRYKVREIAQQSGLSEATVDRVLNQRPGVRENTRAEVMQAIADLDKQRAQLRLNGRRYLIDVVMQTPQRFSDAFRAAVEAELPAFAPAMVRARFHLWESGSTTQMVDAPGDHAIQPAELLLASGY
jgi:LacI family transcriptional regulator